MPNYNTLTIIGHLGRAPEAKATPSGKTMTTFPVAVTEYTKKKDADGFDEKTTWFDCTCWDKYLAEKITRSGIQKGAAVLVTGPVSVRAFAGSDGSPKASMMVTVREFVSLERRNTAPKGENSGAPARNPYSKSAGAQGANVGGGTANPPVYDSYDQADEGLPF